MLNITCGECTKYEGRVYSISGADKRFPKLPEQVFEYGGFHMGCHHSFFPFYDCTRNMSIYVNENDGAYEWKQVDAVKYSNRPFVDNRSPQEKENYEKRKKEKEKKNFWNYDDLVNHIRNAAEYDWVCRYISDLAPKSLNAYTRMKNSNSKNYSKIKVSAEKMGKKLI